MTNFNLLSPNKFRIVINRFKDVSMFAQRVVIPGATMGTPMRPTNRYTDYFELGDKILYEDLIVSFLLDEDLETQESILQWMKEGASSELDSERFSDLSLIVLTNNSNKNKTYKFYNTFPYTTTSAMLDTGLTEDNPLTLDVIFKFSHYEIE